ncbi:MAG: protein-L-isoaspartate O-methyltransferase [bacterium]|nr:protein-L-isoaspartate O-methyltransferase [bacterium]
MEELVQHLKEIGVLKTPALVEAFSKIDRRDFVLPEYQDAAYEDYPLPIGFGQTISQPYTVAFMLELLNPEKGEKILDVGSGSGWTAALLAYLVGSSGRVIGKELQKNLVRFARENLAKYPELNVEIFQAKKGALGLPKESPFDKILVSAAAKEIPKELLSQLAKDGVMVLPVENAVLRIQKRPGKAPDIKKFEGFAFVPLL